MGTEGATAKITLVWGYGDTKGEEFSKWLDTIGDMLRKALTTSPEPVGPLTETKGTLPGGALELRPVSTIHITLLGCEAIFRSGMWYNLPLLRSCFPNEEPAQIEYSKLRGLALDFTGLMRILEACFDKEMRLQFGGNKNAADLPMLHPGWTMRRMSFYFGFMSPMFVVTGWPVPRWGWQLMGLRALAEHANVMHKYHVRGKGPPDPDAYAVLGEVPGYEINSTATDWHEVEPNLPPQIQQCVNQVRDWMENNQHRVALSPDNIEFIQYDDPSLARAVTRLPLAMVQNADHLEKIFNGSIQKESA